MRGAQQARVDARHVVVVDHALADVRDVPEGALRGGQLAAARRAALRRRAQHGLERRAHDGREAQLAQRARVRESAPSGAHALEAEGVPAREPANLRDAAPGIVDEAHAARLGRERVRGRAREAWADMPLRVKAAYQGTHIPCPFANLSWITS